MIGTWIYIAGLVVFWRYHVGFFLNIEKNNTSYYGSSLSGFDIAWSLFMGTVSTFLWPLSVGGRAVYVLLSKYGGSANRDDVLFRIFPAPGQIETKAQKRKRKEIAARNEINERRKEINQHERDNGMELTKWVS